MCTSSDNLNISLNWIILPRVPYEFWKNYAQINISWLFAIHIMSHFILTQIIKCRFIFIYILYAKYSYKSTGLLLIWISTRFYVRIWHVNLVVPTDSVWKVTKGKIDIFWCVDMKLDRITCTKHVLIVLIGTFYMCYVKPKLRQFSNSALVRRGQKVKNGGYWYCRICIDSPIVT